MDEKRSKPDQYQLRFPPGMRDRLKAAADANSRSMNAEMLARLEAAESVWPNVQLPPDMIRRAQNADPQLRAHFEARVSEFAVQLFRQWFPSDEAARQKIVNSFDEYLDQIPNIDRRKIREHFKLAMDDFLKTWRIEDIERPQGNLDDNEGR